MTTIQKWREMLAKVEAMQADVIDIGDHCIGMDHLVGRICADLDAVKDALHRRLHQGEREAVQAVLLARELPRTTPAVGREYRG